MLRHPVGAAGHRGPRHGRSASMVHIEFVLGALRGGGFSLELAHHSPTCSAAGSSASPRTCSRRPGRTRRRRSAAIAARYLSGQFPRIAELAGVGQP